MKLLGDLRHLVAENLEKILKKIEISQAKESKDSRERERVSEWLSNTKSIKILVQSGHPCDNGRSDAAGCLETIPPNHYSQKKWFAQAQQSNGITEKGEALSNAMQRFQVFP